MLAEASIDSRELLPAKHLVKARFDRAAATYDTACMVQRAVCQHLLLLLHQQRQNYQQVLDVACGTGESTVMLQQQLGYQRLYALDLAPKLLQKASQKCMGPNQHVVLGDFEQMPFATQTFDLVLSNMGLQWSSHLSTSLQQCYRLLTPGGIVAFAMPVAGSFPELTLPRDDYAFGQVVSLLELAGFQGITACVERYVQHFGSAIAALRSLKAVGANVPLSGQAKTLMSKRQLLATFHNPKQVSLTYQIGFFIGRVA